MLTYHSLENRETWETWECDAVAVCSGLHVLPNFAQIQGIGNVPIVFHSSEFKRRAQFGVGTNVLVVGSGETGADVAYMAVTSPTARVVMCHRDGFHLAPKVRRKPMLTHGLKCPLLLLPAASLGVVNSRSRADQTFHLHPPQRNPHPYVLPSIFGKSTRKYDEIPIDVSRGSLFDTFYVHPTLRNGMALWKYYDWHVKSILWWIYGTTAGMDQWIGGVSPARDRTYKRES
jgi:dimethylaniline monooxygenase (N-oxide forming)